LDFLQRVELPLHFTFSGLHLPPSALSYFAPSPAILAVATKELDNGYKRRITAKTLAR